MNAQQRKALEARRDKVRRLLEMIDDVATLIPDEARTLDAASLEREIAQAARAQKIIKSHLAKPIVLP